MARINVPMVDEYGELTRTGWFDDDTATRVKGATYWDGNNHASVHAGPTRDQHLWRTPRGRYVLQHTSQRVNEPTRYEFISADDAREWLIKNESDDLVKEWFGALEEESGPDPEPVNRGGRPRVGEQIAVAYPPDLLARVDAAAAAADLSRAAWLRRAAEEQLRREA